MKEHFDAAPCGLPSLRVPSLPPRHCSHEHRHHTVTLTPLCACLTSPARTIARSWHPRRAQPHRRPSLGQTAHTRADIGPGRGPCLGRRGCPSSSAHMKVRKPPPKHTTQTHGMAGRTSLRREGANEAGNSNTTVAHTLTACTRCRVVGSQVPVSYRRHRLTSCSVKQGVIQICPSAGPANGQAQHANTTTPARAES